MLCTGPSPQHNSAGVVSRERTQLAVVVRLGDTSRAAGCANDGKHDPRCEEHGNAHTGTGPRLFDFEHDKSDRLTSPVGMHKAGTAHAWRARAEHDFKKIAIQ